MYVDRFDKRSVLIVTNLLRGAAFVATFLSGGNLIPILLLNIFVSTVTVFFAPAEASMIPTLVPRRQLLAANGVFTLTLNASFALGFALLGPIVVTLSGAPALLLLVAALYFVAAAFCWTLPPAPPEVMGQALDRRSAVHDAEEAVGSTVKQPGGPRVHRLNRQVSWSLVYLAVSSSLVGVLGVLGPSFATETLGLDTKDFVVVVLPLGFRIVMGILLLNSFGRYAPRRRVIEAGLVALGILLALLAIAGPLSQFLSSAEAGIPVLSAVTSLLAIVVLIALLAGISYAFVAILRRPSSRRTSRRRSRSRVRHPQHARVGGELPADHHRRPVVRHLRDDQRAAGGRAVDPDLRDRVDRDQGPLLAAESASRARWRDGPPVDPLSVAIHAELPDHLREDTSEAMRSGVWLPVVSRARRRSVERMRSVGGRWSPTRMSTRRTGPRPRWHPVRCGGRDRRARRRRFGGRRRCGRRVRPRCRPARVRG